MDVTEVRRGVERIEPIERRNAWLAVIDGAYDENATTTFRERLRLPVGRIESTLAQAPWLAGPVYSIADIDAYALVDPLRELAPAVVNAQSTPRIVDWLDRIAERPATRAARSRARRSRPPYGVRARRRAVALGLIPARREINSRRARG